MTDVHTPAFWRSVTQHHKETRALHEAWTAYHEACNAGHQWALAQIHRGQPLPLVVATLRIKYARAWRRLLGRLA